MRVQKPFFGCFRIANCMVMDSKALLRRLKSEPIRRTVLVERRQIDEQNRTVGVAFASELPIDHDFGRLILTITPAAMRSDRLRAGAAVLLEHNWHDQIGVVDGFTIDGPVARATIRFSRSARAEEVFQDVIDGIRRNVSVGVMIHELHLERNDPDGVPVFRSDDWTPYEISIVSVPADTSVGVGRKIQLNKEGRMQEENTNVSPAVAAAEEVRAWAKILGGNDEVVIDRYLKTCVRRGETPSVDGMRAVVRAARPDTAVLPAADPADVAAIYGGITEYARSVPRVRLQGFTGDRAAERAHGFGQWLLGGPFGNRSARQWCEERGLILRRSQNAGLNEKGGFLVPEQFGNDIIDLVEKYGIFRQYSKNVPMTSDRRTDPVIDGELESQFVGELEEGADQDLEFGMIGLTAHKHMVLVPLSSEISEDAAISIADTVATAAARAFAKKEDQCGFNGDATSTFGGLVGIREKLKSVDPTPANIAGLQVGSGNAYSELTLTDFQGVVGRLPDYADTGNVNWFVSRRFYFNVMVKLLLSGSPTATEIEDARNRRFLGYPVVFTKVMPSTEANSQVCAIFGDLSLGARFGDRRAVTIALDESILFRKDALLLRATSRFAINIHGVGSTTEAGPICGLITAAA